MLQIAAPTQIDRAVSALAAWLQTMRGRDGYGGPVAHWWQQSLIYTGAGLDWRYEGIIAGSLLLWQRTGEARWLVCAQQAGDDLIHGQMPDGHYPASAFEINPATAGTPHEAACDVGLLLLAQGLHQANHLDWQRYAAAAERNLLNFYVKQLWNKATRSFNDRPGVASFVPNKAATASEALFLLAEISGDSTWAESYAIPNMDRILTHQIRGGRLDGAIAQNSFGAQVIDKYFPIYIARCVPVLLRAYCWTDDERYLDGAIRAMRWIVRWTNEDGTCPTVVYANGRENHNPCWIAALGDVLRAADEARDYGFAADMSAMRNRLLAGQDRSGGIQTASGFAAQGGGRLPTHPDVRDVLHVTGWCDKAFRYLAAHAGSALPEAAIGSFETDCVFQGRALRLQETTEQLEIRDRRGVCYRWQKGEPWPEIASPLFWLR